MENDIKKASRVDNLINRWVSKKLGVFLISTFLLIYHYVTAEQWIWIAGLYIGGQHMHDSLINFRHGPHGNRISEANLPTEEEAPKEDATTETNQEKK